ncbi:MAG: nitric oxide reductase activation protein NorD [Rhodoferax sp.]
MEEIVGQWWHKAITRVAQTRYPAARVALQDMHKSIGILFRAAGGDSALRISPGSDTRVGGYRGWLQRLAASDTRADLAQLEPDVLALPAELAVFPDATLNRDLYLWLAMQSAAYTPSGHWLRDNHAATARALQAFAGFRPRYQRLLQTHLAQRRPQQRLRGAALAAEQQVLQALQHHTPPVQDVQPQQVAPVWLWIQAHNPAPSAAAHSDRSEPQAQDTRRPSVQDPQRRRTRRAQEEDRSNPFILPFRAESLLTWSELVKVNRSTDDEEDGNALAAANDMEYLSVAPDGQTLAARVKFDLDLPSSSADDRPLGPGETLPEWDYRAARLIEDHCAVQAVTAREAQPLAANAALRQTARQLRRRLEVLRELPRPLHAQESGDAIDLDAWVRFACDEATGRVTRSDTPAVYTRQVRTERSLSTLLLADLSLSTDAYATDSQKVIDVIRDALYVFGEGLHSTGDAFAMWGFSSVRRQHVRMNHLKRFDDAWNDGARARLGAIKPGYYTRMGAAIRYASAQLQKRPERRKLLMLLTDGKPNDLDQYEGRYGIEDTRAAVHEARQMGLSPFCVTIDATGHDYLPYLFGSQGYALVHRPTDLVRRLTQAWSLLAR